LFLPYPINPIFILSKPYKQYLVELLQGLISTLGLQYRTQFDLLILGMTEEAIHQFLWMSEFHHSWKYDTFSLFSFNHSSSFVLTFYCNEVAYAYDSYRGEFHIRNRQGIIESTYDRFQAHLSTCPAVEVINIVSSLPKNITLDELPRSSIWPSQFTRAQVTKEDIGLYFFAEDVNRFVRHFFSIYNDKISFILSTINFF